MNLFETKDGVNGSGYWHSHQRLLFEQAMISSGENELKLIIEKKVEISVVAVKQMQEGDVVFMKQDTYVRRLLQMPSTETYDSSLFRYGFEIRKMNEIGEKFHDLVRD